MTNNEVALRTRRKKARYGTKVEIAGQQEDFITAEEIVEDLYGKPVDHIVFKEVVSF